MEHTIEISINICYQIIKQQISNKVQCNLAVSQYCYTFPHDCDRSRKFP